MKHHLVCHCLLGKHKQYFRLFQVEVENAGIKSFAEIMAEKKRKRLLAQQESKKNITPIVFEDKPGKYWLIKK